MSESKATSMTKKDEPEKKQGGGHRYFVRKPDDNKKMSDGIPMLKFGKGNNFHKFKHALSEVALKEFGNLGKLINLGKYYVPQINQASLPPSMTLFAKQQEVLELEMLKEYNKQVANCPKLYGLIRQHMSLESKDEVSKEPDYEVWHADTDPEKLWQAIEKTHKVDSISNVTEVKALVARKSYQNIKQGSFESLAQYSERFRETYRAYKDSATNVDVEEADQAMDFFHGLDAGQYGVFKMNMMNGWTTGAFPPPTTVNQIYQVAGNWVKPTSRIEGGTSATYVTIEEGASLKKQKAKAKQAASEKGDGEEKPKKDRSQLECWYCKEKGHFSSNCPKKKKAKEDQGIANVTWLEQEEFCMSCTTSETMEYKVNNAVNMTQKLTCTEILLDNQADISIVHPQLLENVRPAERNIRVKGVGGVQVVVSKKGKLKDFFEVYASEDTKANVLSFADVEDMYQITYVQGEAFIVHMRDRDLIFRRRDKLYVADLQETAVSTVQATVRENELVYTKEEVNRAKQAHQCLKNSGYPSIGEAVHLLTDGNIRGAPMLMQADLERAYRMYGLHPEYVRGKLTKKTVSRMQVDPTLRSTTKNLKLYADVMHIDTKKFLVSVANPLNLTLQSVIAGESRQELGMALQGQLAVLRSKGFIPSIVYVDPQSAFKAMTRDFPGVEIDVGGAGDYIAKVDSRIRRIKETYRSVKSGLAWSLPRSLVPDLVAYVVSRLNIRRTSALADNVCP
jgi:hypothetical protein